MDREITHLKNAWGEISPNLVGWIVFILVFGLIVGFTGGIGAILMPNAIRGMGAAIDAKAAPEIGALFNFDNIANDAIGMVIYGIGIMVGSIACGIGALVTGTLLFWMPLILADEKMPFADAAQTSFAHAKANFVPTFVFMLLFGIVANIGSIAFGIGSLLTAPIAFAAMITYWREMKGEVLAAAG